MQERDDSTVSVNLANGDRSRVSRRAHQMVGLYGRSVVM
jgi:hypothetical protein